MIYEFELCHGRHDTPASMAIFPHDVDPTNMESMRIMADRSIPNDATLIKVFVTGLTPAILSVIEVCLERRIALIAFHYDRTTGDYIQQIVVGGPVISQLRLADKVLNLI